MPQNKREQVLEEPAPRQKQKHTEQFTRIDLARTLGELQKLGLIAPYHDTEDVVRFHPTKRFRSVRELSVALDGGEP